jgi:hypothetical protein
VSVNVKSTALSEGPDDPQRDPQLDPQLDPQFAAAIARLHELTVWGRWAVAIGLWLTVGSWSLWQMRKVWDVAWEYFSWSAIRYGLIFNQWAAMGLGLCVGMTLSVLIWQSRNILWGLPEAEQQALQKRVLKIHQQGTSHPLWKWVYGNSHLIKPKL